MHQAEAERTHDQSDESVEERAGDIARTHAEARDVLDAAVGAQDPGMHKQVARAAAVAAALRAPAASRVIRYDDDCWMRASLAWSLASITTARASATAPVLDALIDVAVAPEPCKDGYGAVAARVYAVRGLAVLSAPRAVQTLRDLAKGTCAHPIETWPTRFERANEGFAGASRDVGCWAQAALAHGPDADGGKVPGHRSVEE